MEAIEMGLYRRSWSHTIPHCPLTAPPLQVSSRGCGDRNFSGGAAFARTQRALMVCQRDGGGSRAMKWDVRRKTQIAVCHRLSLVSRLQSFDATGLVAWAEGH